MSVAIVGSFMNPEHRAEVTATINAPPDSVFNTLTDYKNYPIWRKELLHVEMMEYHDSLQTWREYDKDKNNWAFQTVEYLAPSHLKIKIAEPKSAIQGTWTISILPTETGSAIHIIEEGSVSNVFFRFIGRVFFSQTSTLESYLSSLASRFGQELSFN